MTKYLVEAPLDYVVGHLREGVIKCTVEADSKEEALVLAKEEEGEVTITSWFIKKCGDPLWEDASVCLCDE